MLEHFTISSLSVNLPCFLSVSQSFIVVIIPLTSFSSAMNNLLLNLSIEFLISLTYFLFFNFYLFLILSFPVICQNAESFLLSPWVQCVWLKFDYGSICKSFPVFASVGFHSYCCLLTCLVVVFNCVLDIVFAKLFVEIIWGLRCFSLLAITHICFFRQMGHLWSGVTSAQLQGLRFF